MEFLSGRLHWFKAQTKARQLQFLGVVFVVSSLTLILYFWVQKTSYSVLFNNLANRDANQIIEQLEQAKINYKLEKQGTEILIDKGSVDKTRIKLMNGIQFSGSVGFELFDKTDFGMTEFSQKINYQRAMQGELERTIMSFNEVQRARVHLVIPEQHLFQQNQPRAAISLQLIHPLNRQQLINIQQLIAAAVPHLQIKNIVIVDQYGSNLIHHREELVSTQLESKKKIEHYLTEKLLQILNSIFSKNEFMVKIDVSLNYDRLQQETVKPQQEGMVTHEKEIQHSTLSKTEKTVHNEDRSTEKSYRFGTKKERYTRASGTIERLSLSIVVPENTSAKNLQQIERIAKSVVGFNAKRGDCISIEALVKTSRPFTLPSTPLMQKNDSTNSMNVYFYAFATSLSLVFLFLLFRVSQKNKRQSLLIELKQWLNKND